ncbi:lysozyme inhibitor LprI family protein [Sphingomonas crusticola]|uniref:lysozyme inhibitor LprI family protein n=1 Tax=Sphingomonas crusticola TaxID=1697973 RepID=UPI000E25956C|nr:lysozyme inhibitor LprI family protein [Sphingomonas crusticola]
MIVRLLALTLLAVTATPASAAVGDPTAAALDRCLDDPGNASTAAQTDCEGRAAHDYDRRLNAAYRALLKGLPAPAAQRLRVAQRAWLAFRSADAQARSTLYQSRQGTMYVPMQAHGDAAVVRDRALQLEAYLRALRIEG